MLSGGWDSIRFVISLVFNLVYIVDIFPEFDFWGIIGNWYWNPYVQTGSLCVSLLFKIALELLMLLAIWITTNAYKPHLKIVKISATSHVDAKAALLDALCVRQKWFDEIGAQLANKE